jgi:hypothetical protein
MRRQPRLRRQAGFTGVGVAVVAVSVALGLAGCAGSSAPADSVAAGSGGTPSSATPQAFTVDEHQNGSTLHAHVGDTVAVTLHSTYWQLAAPGGSALTVVASPSPGTGGRDCPNIAGSGCGAVTASYRVSADGTATLTAHRDSCGEALRCGPKDSDWTLTIEAAG